jgi:hypothetical protein
MKLELLRVIASRGDSHAPKSPKYALWVAMGCRVSLKVDGQHAKSRELMAQPSRVGTAEMVVEGKKEWMMNNLI